MKKVIKILLKDIKEVLNKWKDISCFLIKLFNIVKIFIKLIYK